MTAADLSRVDVPLADLIARVDALTVLRRARMAAGLLAEDRHQCDPDDTRFALLPCTCTTVSTAADYPGFDAWIAQQQNLNTAARRTR
ncbi:hypothetical protein [Streptomyces microflavus]|uniref:hypothetical protein n=1 Tax=Streptomyces microflavus TaxID=1919 RepID=UPI002E2FF863|nr:hypothetical protein [Streptomyces microflavus]